MQVAGAEDDDLLLRPAAGAQPREQVGAHRLDALRQDQVVVELARTVCGLQLLGRNRRAGACVDGAERLDVLAGEGAPVDRGFQPHDLAGGQIAVLLRLDQRVGIDRLAEVGDVVGADALVLGGCRLDVRRQRPVPARRTQLARRGGQADLDRLRIALKHRRPAPPGRAVALVDDDDREGVLAVMPAQEAVGPRRAVLARLAVDAQRLVGGDVDAGVARRVEAARLGAHRPHAAARKRPADLVQRLLAQLVAVAQEQRRLAQQPRLVQPPQQVRGNHRLARASRQAQQGARRLPVLLAAQDLLEDRPDRGALVVARPVIGAAVGLEQHGRRRPAQVHAAVAQVARRQLGMGRELAQRPYRVARLLRHPVELGIAVAVGREQVAHRVALQRAGVVALGLLHALERVGVLVLGLDHAHRQRLGQAGRVDAQQVVGAALAGAAPALQVVGRRLDRSGCLKAHLPALVIALAAQDRINQPQACFRLVRLCRHRRVLLFP